MLEVLLRFGGDLRVRNDDGMTPFQFQGSPADLCPVHEVWTPHRMLPKWRVTVFGRYNDCCNGFRDGVFALLLCLMRYRHLFSREVGMQIVEYVAEMHRKEMWWPVEFDIRDCM